jgi:hypothetical protein
MVNGEMREPDEGSLVVASTRMCPDRTMWERRDGFWYCLCCTGCEKWDDLEAPFMARASQIRAARLNKKWREWQS